MSRRVWTTGEERRATAWRRAGETVAEIARRLDRSRGAVADRLSHLGVVVAPAHRATRKRGQLRKSVSKLLLAGVCVRDVAERLGVFPSVVTVIRKRLGLPASDRSAARRRAWEWRRKVDPGRLQELLAAGLTRAAIAAALGCSLGSVANAKRRLKHEA